MSFPLGPLSPLMIIAFALFLLGSAPLPARAVSEPDKGTADDASAGLLTPKESVPELRIHGIEGALLENVQVYLRLKKEPCDAPPWRVHQRYGQAGTDIARALRALGYYRPMVEKHLTLSCRAPKVFEDKVTPTAAGKVVREKCKNDCWSARFVIDPGSPVHIDSIRLAIQGEADDDSAFRALRDALPIQKGEVLNHEHYRRTKDAILALAARLGYFDGRFTAHELRVDTENLRAMVHLAYDSGSRYRFGKLHIHHRSLDNDFIEQIIDWRENDPFDTQKLAAIHHELVDSGYFSTVEVRPRLQDAGGRRIPVDVNLTPRKRYRFSVGLGATTDGGPSGGFSVLNRRVNTRGHRWSSDIALSLVESTINTEYRIPLADPRTDWLSLQAGYQIENTDAVESNAFRFGVRHTRRYTNDWLGTLSLDALRESFMTGTTDDVST
ncbi:MAG: hypothetical protein KJO08_10775, partial [Gammaproteobacteria bacterium]|nr:hypothetical protein [Gammaproteobacteria bacterium]